MSERISDRDVDLAMSRMGHYRVRRAQTVAAEGKPDGISGALLLAFGLRETGLRNIEGGAKLVDGQWVPETDPMRMDVGWTQISRRYHLGALKLMPGVPSGTWQDPNTHGPTPGKTAADPGYVPRFEEALQYTISELHESMAYGQEHGVRDADLVRFVIAAHNAGRGGALSGYHVGDVDHYTTGGDYSAWVVDARTKVNSWLSQHTNWRVA